MPLHLRLFNYHHHHHPVHVQNGYAYASPPNSPVMPVDPYSCSLRTRRVELARTPLEQHTRVFYMSQELKAHFHKDPNSPCPACPCAQRSKRAVGKQARIGLDEVISHDGGSPSHSRRQTRTHTHHPDSAPAVTAMEIQRQIQRLAKPQRPIHLRGQRQHDNRRGRSHGWFPRRPKAEALPARVGRLAVIVRARATAMSCSAPMKTNAPGSVMVGARVAGGLG